MRLAAVILLFREQAFIEATVRSIYPFVDSICCATQYDRNLAGKEVVPDQSVSTLLKIPDPDNKIRLVVQRDPTKLPGIDVPGKMRNAARALDPLADYYLVVDSDEVWDGHILRKCWEEVQRTQWAAYRISSFAYFKKWNYRIIEKGDGYRPLVFLRQGFAFKNDRQIEWHCPARYKEYLRKGRKPKTVYFPSEWRLHHGSCVGDDKRISTKLDNYSHAELVDPKWVDRVWKNFDVNSTRNIHYFSNASELYEKVVEVPAKELPEEVTRCSWPEGWIDR